MNFRKFFLSILVLLLFLVVVYLIRRVATDEPEAFLPTVVTAVLATAFFVLAYAYQPPSDPRSLNESLQFITRKLIIIELHQASAHSYLTSVDSHVASIRDRVATIRCNWEAK